MISVVALFLFSLVDAQWINVPATNINTINYQGATQAWQTLGSASLEEVPSIDPTKPAAAAIPLTSNKINQNGNAWLTTPFPKNAFSGGFSQKMAFTANSPNPAGTNGGLGVGIILAGGQAGMLNQTAVGLYGGPPYPGAVQVVYATSGNTSLGQPAGDYVAVYKDRNFVYSSAACSKVEPGGFRDNTVWTWMDYYNNGTLNLFWAKGLTADKPTSPNLVCNNVIPTSTTSNYSNYMGIMASTGGLGSSSAHKIVAGSFSLSYCTWPFTYYDNAAGRCACVAGYTPSSDGASCVPVNVTPPVSLTGGQIAGIVIGALAAVALLGALAYLYASRRRAVETPVDLPKPVPLNEQYLSGTKSVTTETIVTPAVVATAPIVAPVVASTIETTQTIQTTPVTTHDVPIIVQSVPQTIVQQIPTTTVVESVPQVVTQVTETVQPLPTITVQPATIVNQSPMQTVVTTSVAPLATSQVIPQATAVVEPETAVRSTTPSNDDPSAPYQRYVGKDLTVTRPYKATAETELTVSKGDLIRVGEINRDLWTFGTNVSSLKSGWFPLSCFSSG